MEHIATSDSGRALRRGAALPADHRANRKQNPVDQHVGERIRERRTGIGVSLQQLAGLIGVTCQQAYKYEHGLNRVSAGRLFAIAEALQVSVTWFFDELPARKVTTTPLRQRSCLELARNFAAIDNEKHQVALAQMAQALAAQSLARRRV